MNTLKHFTLHTFLLFWAVFHVGMLMIPADEPTNGISQLPLTSLLRPANIVIEDIFIAQTHVLRPDDPYFRLTSNRKALLKVNITSADEQASPTVVATLMLGQRTTKLILKGPAKLPRSIQKDQHTFANSFTADIPSDWVNPGLKISISAGNAQKYIEGLKIGADHTLRLRYFDFRAFGDMKVFYEFTEESFKEMEAKLPINKFDFIYAGQFDMPAFVIFPYKGNPARVATTDTPDNHHSLTFLRNLAELQRANGEFYTTYYAAGMSTAGGGWGGGTRFAGISSFGVFWHEFGHSLSLPHNDKRPEYPYKGDNISQFDYNAGPVWAYDPVKRNFIPPTIQDNSIGGTKYQKNWGWYKHDPMWQKDTDEQEKGYYFMHFSDYNIFKIKEYLEQSYERKSAQGGYEKWDVATSSWVPTKRAVWEYPSQENLPVYSLFGMASVTKEANFIYNPMAYTGNLIRTYDPTNAADKKAMQEDKYCEPCNLTLKIVQGGKTKYFALRNYFKSDKNPQTEEGTQPWAVNVPQSDGKIELVQLFYTPNLVANGFSEEATLLKEWKANAVNIPKAPEISGVVWLDDNRNGKRDEGEQGIAGVEIKAWQDKNGDGKGDWNASRGVVKTNEKGEYSFGGLESGAWQLILEGQSNFAPGKVLANHQNSSGENNPEDKIKGDDNGITGGGVFGGYEDWIVTKPFRIAEGGNPYSKEHPNSNKTIDFGFYTTHSTAIGGKVWLDANKNKQWDSSEKGIAKVKLVLWKDTDGDGKAETYLGNTETDANGYYRFDKLTKGVYQVFVWEVDNFKEGGALFGMSNVEGAGNPNILVNTDDNGVAGGTSEGGPVGSFISQPINISEKALQKGTYSHAKGSFESIDGKLWIENYGDKSFQFECYATDELHVYLKAHVLIKLPRYGGTCYFKNSEKDTEWKSLYSLKWMMPLDNMFDGQFSNGTVDFGFYR